MYLSHGELEGGLVSSPTQRHLSNAPNSFTLRSSNSHYPNQMAYFDDHASFYSTSSTREEFNTYQFLNQTTATEEANYQFEGHSYGTLTDLWNKFEQPEPTVGSPTALPATAGDGKHCYNLFADWCLTLGSPELLALATSYPDQTDGYGQPPYSSYYWPEVCQQAQSYDSGSLSHGFSSASMAVPEPFAANPTPSSGKRFSL